MDLLKTARRSYDRARLAALLRFGRRRRIYHPLPHTSFRSERMQGTLRRWEAIERFLSPVHPASVLDIGCNTGFFSLHLAKSGAFCLGLDDDRRALRIARLLARLEDVERACFMRFVIAPGNVRFLPRFEVTLCLSIFHHWALRYGREGALAVTRTIADRTDRILIFETAQSDSCSEKYKAVLPDMGTDPRSWLESFVTGLGFPGVRSLGSFEVGGAGGATRELIAGVRE